MFVRLRGENDDDEEECYKFEIHRTRLLELLGTC